MIHRGEKPFQCNICNKQFREKSNYNFHIKKHFLKFNKKKKKNEEEEKNKQNLVRDDLVKDNNIINFCIYNNLKFHNSSDINNNINIINNNRNEINNYFIEINNNDNILNKIKDSMLKYTNLNNKNINNNFNNNYQLINQFPNKNNNILFNYEKEDEFNIHDEQFLKDEINFLNNKNIIFSNNLVESNINSKNDNNINDDYGTPKGKEEKEKNELNYGYMNLIDNVYMNNNINQNNDLIIPNYSNIGFGVDNRLNNNYCQVNFPFPLSFEHILQKDNFN